MTIPSITFNVDRTGTANVDMQVHMNQSEKLQYAVISKIVDFSDLGEEQLEKALNKTVTINSISPDTASFIIEDFATIVEDDMIAPKIEYVSESGLLGKELQPLLEKFNINFIPEKTIIQFSDGYKETFENYQLIPSITHTR